MKNHTDVLIFQSRIGSEVSQIRFEATIETAYAWYLLAYSTVKNDYRIYKLLRMENAEMTEQEFRGRNTNRTYKNREVCAPYISL